MKPLPVLRIRFCGGCNPEIERGEIVEQILEFLTGHMNPTFDPEIPADLTLHVCGCPHACLDEQNNAEEPGPIVSIQGLRVNRHPVRREDLPDRAAKVIRPLCK